MFTPERKVVTKYDRENITMTSEHVESVMKWITDRDINILRQLVKHPFLNTSQIEMLLFNDLKPSSWRTKTNERLNRLYKTNCIDRWFPYTEQNAGSSEAHYVLDNIGARVLGIKLGYNPKQFKFRKRDYIPQDYKHMLKIYDFEALLHLLNRQTGGEIREWNTEKRYKFYYNYDNKINEGNIQPDAFCELMYDRFGRVKFFFLEVDNATEPIETVKSKLLNYRRFFASGEWRKEEWARKYEIFPAMLFIFHSEESVKEMVAYSRRLNSNLRFYFTTFDKLYQDKHKLYVNSLGKKRKVVQERNVRILDSIWYSKDGLVSL